MKYIAIIPARYASTRFPGKPLAMLGGKTVIQRVYEQATSVLPEAYVATDDERIFQAVEAFGGKAVMTRPDHKSGTDRIQEAAEKIASDQDQPTTRVAQTVFRKPLRKRAPKPMSSSMYRVTNHLSNLHRFRH